MALCEDLEQFAKFLTVVSAAADRAAFSIDDLHLRMEKFKMDATSIGASLDAIIKKFDDATTAVGARITTLTGQIADLTKKLTDAGSIDATAAAAITAKLTALNTEADHLNAMGKDAANPIPAPPSTPPAGDNSGQSL